MELYLYMYLIYNHIKRNKIYTYITIGAGGESHHRFAVPLPLTREAKDEGRRRAGSSRPTGLTGVRRRTCGEVRREVRGW